MQEFLDHVLKILTDNPEDIEITPVEQDGGTHYQIKLHPDDVGKIIGRNGATIHALRSLIQVGGAKKGLRCTLDIVEDEPRPPRPPRRPPSEGGNHSARRRDRSGGGGGGGRSGGPGGGGGGNRPPRRPRQPSRGSA